MSGYDFTLAGVAMTALPSGGLHIPTLGALIVSDLHLGKSERIARREGRLTPPYETLETLARLDELIAGLRPRLVICLGDSFDDSAAAAALGEAERNQLLVMVAGRRWVWIAGNHDPAPVGFAGECLAELTAGGLVFRHEAAPAGAGAGVGEISGHFHPKARLRGPARRAFLVDRRRVVMPAFGAYTGGLDIAEPVFDGLMEADALALIAGRRVVAAPRAPMMERRRKSA